jgi:glycerol-3-phosphate dehydrogenase
MSMDACDLLVIGGGINGVGIARDAAGRGLSVVLVEREDIASQTSSWSSKLIHGGLRYLEQYEFRLVAESLAEREILLSIAGHLVWPVRFIMPHVPELRPRWMIRAGLFLYDHLGSLSLRGRRVSLPGSHGVALDKPPYSSGLSPALRHGFIYSDCRVDDARLVLANAMDAAQRGARTFVRTACVAARREHGGWIATLQLEGGARTELRAKTIVNAAGPWVKSLLNDGIGQPSSDNVRLVKGSHIVVPRLYSGEHAFILQNDDKRVVFMIPYEGDYTLIGTTDVNIEGDARNPQVDVGEIEYLCRAASRYLARPVVPGDVVWSYAGVRPLYDDGSNDPSTITRDYTLRVDDASGVAPVLSVFGGKLTTYRKLAEHALEKLKPYLPGMNAAWTDRVPLPGSDFAGLTPAQSFVALKMAHPGLPANLLAALFRRHGALAAELLAGAHGLSDLGEDFGGTLTERELGWMVAREWARQADDVLWRRSKAGLHMSPAQRDRVDRWFARRAGA